MGKKTKNKKVSSGSSKVSSSKSDISPKSSSVLVESTGPSKSKTKIDGGKDWKGKGKANGGAINAENSAAAGDKRFAAVSSLPIFRSVPRREKKVTIDQRFQSMFSDEKFQANTKVDKRGRRLNLNTNDNLVKYYNLDEDVKGDMDSDDEEEEVEDVEIKDKKDEDKQEDDSNEEDEEDTSDDDDEEDDLIESLGLDLKPQPGIPDGVRKKLRNINIDYARGEAPLLSDDDSSDDSDSSAGEDADDVVHEWGELDKDAETTEESTRRLALCNMDWDRLKADDLMVLFTSFLPAGGRLLKVSIFPSEFGKKRMAEEELKGPLELSENVIKSEPVPNTEYDDWNPAKTNEDEDEDLVEDDDGDEFQRERLRQYQLNRLKYFYAVMEFDSAGTGEKVYEECDGREYESSAAKIDLRYIPDDMSFDDEEPRDTCDSAVNLKKYHPKFFTTTALQQVKVNCTWDETDPSRKDLIDRVFNKKEQIDDDDLKNYLASSSEESSNEEEEEIKDQPKQTTDKERDAISKYKALLESIGEAEKSKKKADEGLEITWGLGVKEKTKKLVENKLEKDQDKDMTVWEKSLAKKRQEKLAKKKQNEDSAGSDEEVSGSEDEEEGGLSMDFEMGPEGEEYVSSNGSESEDDEEESYKGKNRSKSKSKAKKDGQSINPEASAELELLLMDEDTNKKHFNMKKILENSNESKSKKKRKLRKQKAKPDDKSSKDIDDFKIDVEDSRFSALFTSAQYNIDPSESNFKKTKAMEEIIKEKLKRRHINVEGNSTTIDEPKQGLKQNRDQELSYLVKSVKRKTIASGKEYSHKSKKTKKSQW